MIVSAPHLTAQRSLSISSPMVELTAELPMLALIFTRKLRADDHGLGFGMLAIGGNDGASARHLVAHEFRRDVFPQGHEAHLLGHFALPGVVHLAEVGVAAGGPPVDPGLAQLGQPLAANPPRRGPKVS
jgi:hypothetical protein